MDIHCTICGEPWDIDSLHDAVADGMAEDWNGARRIFFSSGCGSLFNGRPCSAEGGDRRRAEISATLADVLGEDVDGIAAMMDDLEFLEMF